jgi:thiol-disulfide isomerase/thioredoxin
MNRITYLLALFVVCTQTRICPAPIDIVIRPDGRVVPVARAATTSTTLFGGRPSATSTYLKWVNGDLLPGELVSATATHLKWGSKSFVDPFELDVTSLDYMRFATPDMTKHGEPIRIVLANGDIVFGDLIGITADFIEFTSKRHAQCRVKRSQVVSIQRLAHGSLIYLGPGGRTGWKSLNPSFKTTHWIPVDGYLTTRISGAELYREIEYADQVEVEVILKWIRKPGFLIALGAPVGNQISKGVVGLETWDDTLVIHSEDDFEVVTQITGAMKSIQLRLFLDYAKGECSVFSREGKRLAFLKMETKGKPKRPGFFIRNKGSDLSLVRVRASKWAGSPPKEVQEGINRVHLVDGTIKYGKIKSYDKSKGMVIVDKNGDESTVTYEQFDSMYLPIEVKKQTKLPPTRVSFIDGAVVSGKLVGVKDQTIGILTSYSDQPIWSKLASVRIINLTHPKAPKAVLPPDVLMLSNSKLHGKLAGTSDPKTPLAWLPVGSRNASGIKSSLSGQIIRERPEAGESPIDQGLRDILYLTNQDVVPCKIQAVDDDHLHIATPLVEIKKIPNSDVKAVELALSEPIESEGFGDPGWKVESFAGKGGVDHNPKEIVFHKPGRVSHNTILFGDEASFDIKWNVASSFMITASAFTRDARRMPRGATNVNIQVNQQTIWITGGNGHFFGNVQPVNCPKGTAKIKFKADGKQLKILVNGKQSHVVHFPGGKIPGNGISLSFSPTDGTNGRNRMLVMSNFEVTQSSGGRATPRIASEKKEVILTVPRMRRDNPPSHVLVARNGDMLRGRLTGLSENTVKFTSRLDDFNFARDRLACIIWLHAEQFLKDKKKAKNDAKKDESALVVPENVKPNVAVGNLVDKFVLEKLAQAGVTRLTPAKPEIVPITPVGEPFVIRVELSHGTRITFQPSQVKDGQLIGTSKVLGAVSVPLNAIRKLHMGSTTKTQSTAYADWVLKAAPESKLASSPSRGAGGRSFGSDSPLLGKTIGKITITQLDGKLLQIGQLRGKVVILDFWATWCAPCVSSLPKVMDAVKMMDPNKVIFVAVNEGETKEVIAKFLTRRKWDLRVGLDTEMRIGDKLGASALPHTVVIGPDGKVAIVHTGTHPKIGEELTKVVNQLLEDAAGDPASRDATADPTSTTEEGASVQPLPIENPTTTVQPDPSEPTTVEAAKD